MYVYLRNKPAIILSIQPSLYGRDYDLVYKDKVKGTKTKYVVKTLLNNAKYSFCIDWAKLYFFGDNKVKLIDKIDEKHQDKIMQIMDVVASEYCSWAGFCENVASDSLQGFIDLLEQDLPARKIVNQYI